MTEHITSHTSISPFHIPHVDPFRCIIFIFQLNENPLKWYHKFRFYVLYHQVLSERLNHLAHSAKLIKLSSSTRYRICVLGLGNWISSSSKLYDGNISVNEFNQVDGNTALTDGLMKLLMDTSVSRCTEVNTIDATPSLITDENGLSSHGIIHSLLTRRLGLIVGCCMGIIVFIVLISVLGYLKLKKRRMENSKRQQLPMPPEYISYRHFSIPQEEMNRDGCNHPSFISGTVMGTTTVSCWKVFFLSTFFRVSFRFVLVIIFFRFFLLWNVVPHSSTHEKVHISTLSNFFYCYSKVANLSVMYT